MVERDAVAVELGERAVEDAFVLAAELIDPRFHVASLVHVEERAVEVADESLGVGLRVLPREHEVEVGQVLGFEELEHLIVSRRPRNVRPAFATFVAPLVLAPIALSRGRLSPVPALSLVPLVRAGRLPRLARHLLRLHEPAPPRGDQEPQRDCSTLLDDDVDLVPAHRAQPRAEVVEVRDRRRQPDDLDLRVQVDEDLFPGRAALAVVEEMDLVDHDGVEALELVARQQHVAEDLGRHHATGRVAPDDEVARDEPHPLLAEELARSRGTSGSRAPSRAPCR